MLGHETESRIATLLDNPAGLEALYQEMAAKNQEATFASVIDSLYHKSPDDKLLAAWHYRLGYAPRQVAGSTIRWKLILVLGLLLAALVFFLTDKAIINNEASRVWLPLWIVIPVALVLITYLVETGGLPRKWPLTIAVILCALGGYATIFAVIALRTSGLSTGFTVHDQYPTLAIIHIAGAAALAVIWAVVGRKSEPGARHAALVKALEVAITAGLFGFLYLFTLRLAILLFSALGITITTELFSRLTGALGCGYVPLIALAIVYDPRRRPTEQDFNKGFSRILAILLRVMLPVALIGLLIYVAIIPFHFMRPFDKREVLFVYNVLLFAVIGLIVGATPLSSSTNRSERKWLRLGIGILSGLTIVISLYALSAVIYRTALSGFTANRVTVIGWNIVNIVLLIMLVIRMIRSARDEWVNAVTRTIHDGLTVYTVWIAFLVVALPLLFR